MLEKLTKRLWMGIPILFCFPILLGICIGIGSPLTQFHTVLLEVLVTLLLLLSSYLGRALNLVAAITERIIRGQKQVAATAQKVRPPLNAEFLFFLFMTPENCDCIVGDLEERYKLIHKRFGRRKANFWYWTQVVISLRPIIAAGVKRLSGLTVRIPGHVNNRSGVM